MSIVAKVILEQLGGNKFLAMTGVIRTVSMEDGIVFKLPSSNGINTIRITLKPNDTYTIEFMNFQSYEMKIVSVETDLYFDMLNDVIEEATGLATSL